MWTCHLKWCLRDKSKTRHAQTKNFLALPSCKCNSLTIRDQSLWQAARIRHSESTISTHPSFLALTKGRTTLIARIRQSVQWKRCLHLWHWPGSIKELYLASCKCLRQTMTFSLQDAPTAWSGCTHFRRFLRWQTVPSNHSTKAFQVFSRFAQCLKTASSQVATTTVYDYGTCESKTISDFFKTLTLAK